jgi:hypothetical protein
MSFINEASPLRFTEGDTAYGVQINEPWNTPVVSSAVFHIECLTVSPVSAVTPFDGQGATVNQAAGPPALTTFQYSWPSALARGTYRAHFTATISGGKKYSTGDYLIVVDAA